MHVTHDPERAWAEIAPYVLYEAQTYASFQTGGQHSTPMVDAETIEDLKASPQYLVGTPDQVVEAAGQVSPMGALTFNPLAGGLPPGHLVGRASSSSRRKSCRGSGRPLRPVSSVDPRAPVLVGVGAVTQRATEAADALDALELMARAAERAGEDCGGSGGLGADGPRARASRDLAVP